MRIQNRRQDRYPPKLPGALSCPSNAYIVLEHNAPSALLNFSPPVGARLPFANGSIDKPAEMSRIEFPGGTAPASLRRACLNIPARLDLIRLSPMQGEQKEYLPLDMHGDLPPSLFEALDRLERRPQKRRQLFLGPSEPLSGGLKFLVVHRDLSACT
jgi:hypothetical protein